MNNYGDCVLAGSANKMRASIYNYPKFSGYDFVVDTCYLESYAHNHVYLNVTNTLAGTVYGLGNIYYKGNPPNVGLTTFGSGQAYPQ
ncbi:MAG: DUF2807 domain-containing protein [Cytophagaceae bacterium]|nr:DUF2807 domain-containing protein [Cytophagaceae bacterium]